MDETRDVPICGCTGEQLERGDSCGQANCPNNQPDPITDPAYTVVGRYRDNDQTYITTVYTCEPSDVPALARRACAEEAGIPLEELELDIVAIFEGEPKIVARSDEDELPEPEESLWGIEAEVQVRGRDADDAYRNAQALSDAVARMDCGAVYVVEGDAQRIAEPERVI